jgi:hypothetical protein
MESAMRLKKSLLRALPFALAGCIFTTAAYSQADAQNTSLTPAVATRAVNTYSSSVATEWMSLALVLTQQTPGFSPPGASRALAYLSTGQRL